MKEQKDYEFMGHLYDRGAEKELPFTISVDGGIILVDIQGQDDLVSIYIDSGRFYIDKYRKPS